MQSTEWLPEDIVDLNALVGETLAEGRCKTDAFKQFARERGIKSVNAVRYKWITEQTAAGPDRLVEAKVTTTSTAKGGSPEQE